MAELVVAGSSFNYPEPGEKAGWGEEATAWAEAVTSALADIVGPNDILLSNANILNNQTSAVIGDADPANAPIVSGLQFDVGSVKKVEVPYFVVRTTTDNGSDPFGTDTESGTLTGSFNGSTWDFAQIDATGNSGVEFDIRNDGQVVYYSTDKTGDNYSGIIVFRASTIDN